MSVRMLLGGLRADRRILGFLVGLVAVFVVACGGSSDDATATADAGDATAEATATVAATSAPSEATSAPTEATTPAPTAAMTITSPAFADGESIPFRYTCDGANILPPLEFANVPDGAVTLALVIDDPDAPGGTWDHFVRFNIAPTDGLAEGASSVSQLGSIGTPGINDFETLSYGGPCPPDGAHVYFFKLYAVDGELTLAEGASTDELLAALDGKVLDVAELTGQYARIPAIAAPAGLETTPVIGRIGGPYKFIAGQPVQVGLDELPFEPGSVEAHWYQADGSYVVLYRGLDAGAIAPLCPGNSIQTAAGFQNVSNSPNAAGGCADTVPAPPAGVGVQACGEHLVYVTAIPVTAAGNLYGTVEAFDASGALLGMTSVAVANAAGTPTIDLGSFCGG